MGAYFLASKLWDEIRKYMWSSNGWSGNDGAINADFEAELNARMGRVYRIYKLIDGFIKESDFQSIAGKILWLTIRPGDDFTDYNGLLKFMDTLTKKKYIAKYAYVIEQVGEWNGMETEIPEFRGFHIHAVLQFTNSYSSLMRFINDKCSGWHVFPKRMPESFVDDKLQYMQGVKDKEKEFKVCADRLFRRENGIPAIFINGFSLPQIAQDWNPDMTDKETTVPPIRSIKQEHRDAKFNNTQSDNEVDHDWY